ncbi:DNA polymerase IV [Sphingomonas sp. CFBP 13720]|uniref:DNA polymerase IV n=1 Tax=Sphingomonas sp. CFBP 13720 TaxID=2775302 RepID=UPI001780C952|nr:DNA polymerase IV [Sphingomonas sp. CFBP 13720]MBD8679762.1 DNA polymerase IV [Sphingomonas sp. CFBP 13720]
MAGEVRKIIHVDMDAFFASVEQRDAPELRGLPVAVGGSSGRGVVAAASYEARRFGVRSAMPSVTALRRCPDLVFVRPRFDVYKQVSRQIRAIFLDYTDLVEPLSLDEAYLDVTANRRALPSATATAQEIRDRIRADTGLTASAGISYNKFLAKLASDMNKPDGQCVIPVRAGPRVVAALEVKRFHGIGPKTAERMAAMGIHTGADLAGWDLPALQRMFGKAGRWYHAIARAEDHRPVQPDRRRKSSGSETTFGQDLTDRAAVEERVLAMADDVWDWVEHAGQPGRTVTVKAKYGDFRIVTRSRTLGTPVADRATLHRVALALIATLFPLRMGLRLVGVTLAGFGEASPVHPQLDLL